MTKRNQADSRDYQRLFTMSLVAMLGAAIALILTLVLASIRLEVTANDIAENAAPSIVALSDATRALNLLDRLLENRASGIGDQGVLAAQLRTTRSVINTDINRYLELP